MFNLRGARANRDHYLLLLGADPLLRERAVVSALRTYPGPVFGMVESTVVNANRMFDHVLPANPYNAKEALAAVEAIERETGLTPDAVVPVLELNLHVAVAIATRYGLPTLAEESLALARDKHTMKAAFEQAGIPCARHRLFGSLDELQEVVKELTFPVVLKPRDFAGSVGVVKVDGPDGLAAAFDHCRASLLEIAPTYDFADGRYQVEEYITSTHEVSVEVINYEGQRAVLAVTDKAKGGAPYFTETGQLVPSRETGNAALRELALRACEALLIDRGIAHVEVLLNGSEEMKVVEVAARPGGDGIMDLIDRVYGFNPYDLHIAAYRRTIDRLPEIPAELQGVGAIGFLKAPAGAITAIADVPAQDGPEIARYVTSKVGDTSRAATSYLGRNGVIEVFEPGAAQEAAEAVQQRTTELAARRSTELFTVTEN
ncbi:acetyl-CoA carboxylase biotin carboxylase subunit family protein [Kitasatospora sp. NPDC006697]|uniref:ATP-grasp domain-containing protein n=1 Tax=Kitasatospora sp. NPDC006697 TaxID=3364020 RepID=UPI0036B8FBB2